MMAAGYRPNTNVPGHHATIIQTLPLTLGVDKPRMLVLDTLRRKRSRLGEIKAQLGKRG